MWTVLVSSEVQHLLLVLVLVQVLVRLAFVSVEHGAVMFQQVQH